MGSGGSKNKATTSNNTSPLQNQSAGGDAPTGHSPSQDPNSSSTNRSTQPVLQQGEGHSNTLQPNLMSPVQGGLSEQYNSSSSAQPQFGSGQPNQSGPHAEPDYLNGKKLNEKFIKERPLNEVLETPDILFYFDFPGKLFHHYNITTGDWRLNDLNESKDDCPACPLFKYKIEGEEEEAVKFAKYLTYIALTNDIIYIIGGFNTFFSCLEYTISTNTFSVKKPLKVLRNNPSLCKYSKFIYAISGDNIDTFSKEASMYDTERDEWTTLTHLPSPQGFAAVRVIYESKAALDLHETSFEPKFLNKNYEKNLKIAALGGLSQKFPRTYTPLYSVYSFLRGEWKVYDMSKIFTQRLPKFINCSMVQRREGDLIIAGCEGTRYVFKFDHENMQLYKAGHLPNEDTFSVPMRSRESLYRQGEMYCLAHKFNGRIYQGHLDEEQWEVIN